eukprot:15090-Amphidinium_carterae.1
MMRKLEDMHDDVRKVHTEVQQGFQQVQQLLAGAGPAGASGAVQARTPPEAPAPPGEKGLTAEEWFRLGLEGGGRVAGKTHSEKQCYQIALELDPNDAITWFNLSCVDGGTVKGRAYSRTDCAQKS